MVPDLFFSQLVVLIALVWLCLMLQWTWPRDPRYVAADTSAATLGAQAPS